MKRFTLPILILCTLIALAALHPRSITWFTYIKDWPDVFERLRRGRGQWDVACLYGVLHGLCLTGIAPWYSTERGSDPPWYKTLPALVCAAILALTLYGSTTRPSSEGWLEFSAAAFLETCLVTSTIWSMSTADKKH